MRGENMCCLSNLERGELIREKGVRERGGVNQLENESFSKYWKKYNDF